MKVSILLLAVILSAGAAGAADIHVDCTSANAKCPPLPVIAPPPPPPPPPPIPPLPALPVVPAEAHAACADKAAGTHMTFNYQKGATMSGLCTRDGKKMVFELHSLHSKD